MKKRRDRLPKHERDILYYKHARSCVEKAKEGFTKKRDAVIAAEKREAQVPGLRLWVYRCLFCGKWHKTSSELRQLKR